MVQLKKKLIMQSINLFVLFFLSFFTLQVICNPEKSMHHAALKSNDTTSSSSEKSMAPGGRLQTWKQGLTKGIADSTTRVHNVYSEVSDKVHAFKNSIQTTLHFEVDYIKKDVVPTCIGIPYYYYGGCLLICYASHHSLTYNVQTLVGVIIIVGLFGNFTKWSIEKYNKIYFEQQKK